jgi:hypothetical protein
MEQKPWYKRPWILTLLAIIAIAWGPGFFFNNEPAQAVPTTQPSQNSNLNLNNLKSETKTVEPTKTKAKPEKTQPTQDCNPNYSGCLLPYASDYDCAGGSGNGPYYTGPVRVIGYDQYGLDRDGDGWGCE